jgi:hypothetical protein
MAGHSPAMLHYAASTEQRNQVRLVLLDLIERALPQRLARTPAQNARAVDRQSQAKSVRLIRVEGQGSFT